MKLIDADMEVTAQLFDDMHEEYREEKMPISAFLDLYTNEGFPSAEPKQGEWIEIWENGMSTKAMCNNCKRESDRPLGNFCKWCGARMKGADDEID